MDDDIEHMTRQQLVEEVRKLRHGIREHRDTSKHELCWHHPVLWGLLPEKTDAIPVVPEWPEFMRGCIAGCENSVFRQPDPIQGCIGKIEDY